MNDDTLPPVPLLAGRLVRLRARETADAERAFIWINDREVARFLILRYPQSIEEEREWLRGTPRAGFFGVHLAIDTADGVHIGNIDLRNVQPENRTAELGVMLGDKRYWNRGYGSDAVRTLTRFAFSMMNLQRVHLQTYEYNVRAQHAFVKAGFKEEGRLRRHLYVDGRYWDVVLMGCLREEFEANDEPAAG
ncbi:MAG: GNAT family N-acetyltransferase [Dehalococcoidia bacterium]